MQTFIIHARSVAHVTHLVEANGVTADEALENYWDGEYGTLIGVQIGDRVDLDGMPDTAERTIRGDYYILPVVENDDYRMVTLEAGPGGRKLRKGESYHFSRRILGAGGLETTTAMLEWDGEGHLFRVERRHGRTHFVSRLVERRFGAQSFAEALKHYDNAEVFLLEQAGGAAVNDPKGR